MEQALEQVKSVHINQCHQYEKNAGGKENIGIVFVSLPSAVFMPVASRPFAECVR
jgi:hypothetical protein